jgi:hypothetical protein
MYGLMSPAWKTKQLLPIWSSKSNSSNIGRLTCRRIQRHSQTGGFSSSACRRPWSARRLYPFHPFLDFGRHPALVFQISCYLSQPQAMNSTHDNSDPNHK